MTDDADRYRWTAGAVKQLIAESGAPAPEPVCERCGKVRDAHVGDEMYCDAATVLRYKPAATCGALFRDSLFPSAGVFRCSRPKHYDGLHEGPLAEPAPPPRAAEPPSAPPAGAGEPVCPGPDCMMCNGEACDLCGAGCWSSVENCEHDVAQRHQSPCAAPAAQPAAERRAVELENQLITAWRERDEAQVELAALRERTRMLDTANVELHKLADTLESERDEARAERDGIAGIARERESQRDEAESALTAARAELEALRGLARGILDADDAESRHMLSEAIIALRAALPEPTEEPT